jgi:hypothetical protein
LAISTQHSALLVIADVKPCIRDSCRRPSQGLRPVTGCGFLAYSCAAARELHPLPCLCHGAKTRKPKDISKNGKYWCEEFTGRERWKSTAGRGGEPNARLLSRKKSATLCAACLDPSRRKERLFRMTITLRTACGRGIRVCRPCLHSPRQIRARGRANPAAPVDSAPDLRRWHRKAQR